MKKILFLIPLFLGACGFEIVDEGNRGIKTRFGEVVDKPIPPGLSFYNPFTSSIVEFDVREQKVEGIASSYTKDTQTANIKFIATFYADPVRVLEVYRQYGWEWQAKAVLPSLEARIKDAIGQYVADDIVENQAKASTAAFENLKSTLADRGVILGSLSFVNVDFSDQYEQAVEQKVVAGQKAAEAKNKTVEIEEQAKQKVMSAKADAEAMRIKSHALSQNQNLVSYEAVQKWNGALPQYILGNGVTPFINLKDLSK